jgi:hypothetical protein
VACLFVCHINGLLQLLNGLFRQSDRFFNVDLAVSRLIVDKDVGVRQLITRLYRRGELILELK